MARKADKILTVYGVAFGLIQAFVLWILFPMKADIIRELTEVKKNQTEIRQTVTDNYIEINNKLNKEVNKVDQKCQDSIDEKFDKLMDRIYTLFEDNEEDKS